MGHTYVMVPTHLCETYQHLCLRILVSAESLKIGRLNALLFRPFLQGLLVGNDESYGKTLCGLRMQTDVVHERRGLEDRLHLVGSGGILGSVTEMPQKIEDVDFNILLFRQ